MTRHRDRIAAVVTLTAVVAVLLATPPAVQAQAPQPYRDPPFTCTVIDFGTESPPIPAPPDDPLCVRYDKTNITVSTLGAIDFLAAEPGRIAIVAAKCSYWQQDHWVIRVSPETTPIVSWVGSYWYDTSTASAGGILREMQVAGQPATPTEFIAAIRPLVGDDTANQLEAFTEADGGGGATMALPEGFGGDPCAAGSTESPTTTTTSPTSSTPGSSVAGGPTAAGAGAHRTRSGGLPPTGGSAPTLVGFLLVAAVVGVRRWLLAGR